MTEEAKTQAAKVESDVDLRRMLDTAYDAFVAIDHQGRLIEWNRPATNLFGWERAEVLGRPLSEVLIPEEHRAAHLEGLARYVRTGEERVLYQRLRLPALHREGDTIPVEVTISPLELESGHQFSAFIRDMREEVLREEELARQEEVERERLVHAHNEALADEARRNEERYRQLADSIPQHVWTTDDAGNLDYMNSVGLSYYGVGAEELTVEAASRFVHADDVTASLEAWEQALRDQEVYEARLRLRRHDGEYRWHLVRALPGMGTDATPQWYGTSTDIHAQVEAEAARDLALADLAEVAAQLEQSNRDLDQFAYVASHDLRAPLRGIGNLVRFLEDDLRDSLDDETREMMDLLKARVLRLEQLINGILAYSRVGRVDFAPETVDVGDLVTDVVELLSPPESVTVDIDPGLPTFETSRTPLEQVFQNLISNAFKFAGETGGRVEVAALEHGDHWEFSVADDGPGIAPEFHERIWQIFTTLQPRDEIEGTGIGLALVHKIVESMGGSARVESAPGAGARFSFTWPKPKEEAEHE